MQRKTLPVYHDVVEMLDPPPLVVVLHRLGRACLVLGMVAFLIVPLLAVLLLVVGGLLGYATRPFYLTPGAPAVWKKLKAWLYDE
jgi:hypothetical protein